MAIDWSKLSSTARKQWIAEAFPTYKTAHKNLDEVPTILENVLYYADKYEVDPYLLMSVIKSESDFGKSSISNVAQVQEIAIEDLNNAGYTLENTDVESIAGSVEHAAAFLNLTTKRLEKKISNPTVSQIGAAYFTGVSKLTENITEEGSLSTEVLYEQTSANERGRKIDEYYQILQGAGEYKPNLKDIGGRQEALRIYGAYNNVVDGIEGEGTLDAYRTFQMDNGLAPTGTWNQATEDKLKAYIDKSYKAANFDTWYSTYEEPITEKPDFNTALNDYLKSEDFLQPDLVGITPSAAEYNEQIQQEAIYEKAADPIQNAVGVGGISFLDGLSGGWIQSILNDNNITPIHGQGISIVNNVANIAGHITNMVGLVSVAGAAVKGIQGTKYLGTALKVLDKFTLKAASGALQGTIYTGLDYITSPDELKPTLGDLGINALQFGVGDFARTIVGSLATKYKLNPVVAELFAYTADTLGGAMAAFGVTQDPEQFMQEIGPTAVAIGIVDILSTAHAYKLMKNTFSADTMKVNMSKSLEVYNGNPTPDNFEALIDSITSFCDEALPGNFTNAKDFVEALNAKLTDDINLQIKAQWESKNLDVSKEVEIKNIEDVPKVQEVPKITPEELEAPKVTEEVPKPKAPEEVPKITPEELEAPKVTEEAPKVTEEVPKVEPPEPNIELVRPIENPEGKLVNVEFNDIMDASLYDLAQRLEKGIPEWQRLSEVQKFRDYLGLPEDFPLEDYIARFKNTVDSTVKDGGKLEGFLPKNVDEFKLYRQALEGVYSKDTNKTVQDGIPEIGGPKDVPEQPETITPWKQLQKEILEKASVSKFEAMRLATYYKPSNGFSINTTHFGTDPLTSSNIKDIADFISKDIPKYKIEDIKEGSKKYANDVGLQDKIQELNNLLENAPELAVAYKDLVVRNAEAMTDLAKHIREKRANGQIPTDLEKTQFLYLSEIQKSLTSDLKNFYRNISKTLNSGRVDVGGRQRDLTDLTYNEFLSSNDAMNKVSGTKNTITNDEFWKLIDNFDDSSIYGINKSVQNQPNKWLKAFIEFRSANLLTVNTAVKNMVSQAANVVHETITDFARATVGLPFRALGAQGGMTFGTAAKRFTGNVVGFWDTFVNPRFTVKDAYGITHENKAPNSFDMLFLRLTDPVSYEKLYQSTMGKTRAQVEGFSPYMSQEYLRSKNSPDTPLVNLMWNTLDWYGSQKRLLSFGLLEAGDKPYANAAFYSEISGRIGELQSLGSITKAQAKQLNQDVIDWKTYKLMEPFLDNTAKQKGLVGTDAAKWVSDTLVEKFGYDPRTIMDKPYAETVLDLYSKGEAHALDMTWKSPLKNKAAKAFEDFLRKVPAAKVIVPFFHTPAKIFGKFVDSTPFSRDWWRGVTGKRGYRGVEESLGKLAATAALMGFANVMYMNGNITGNARNSDEKRRMNEAGIPENSIKIGDTWVSYGSLDPAPSMYFSSMAEVSRAFEESSDPLNDDMLSIWTGAFFGVMRTLVNKTYARSIKELTEAVTEERKGEYFLSSLVSSLDPTKNLKGLAKNIEFGGLNPFYKDYLEDTRIGLSTSMPKLDSYGKPIMKYKMIAGSYVSEGTTSPIRQELANLGYSLPKPYDTVNNVKLTPELYYDMLKYMDDKGVEDGLNDFVGSSAYKRLSAQQKIDAIETLYNNYKKSARNYIQTKPEYKQLYQEFQEKKLKRQQSQDTKFNFFKGKPEEKPKTDWIDAVLNFK